MMTIALIRASLWIAISALAVAVLFRTSGLVSARLRRAAWGLILIQGVILTPWSVAIPWRPPATADQASWATHQPLPGWSDDSLAISHSAAKQSNDLVSASATTFSWQDLIRFVWAAGLAAGLIWMAVTYGALLLAARRGQPSPALWQNELDEVLRRLGVRRSIALRLHGSLGPLLCRLPGSWQVIVPELVWPQLTRHERLAVLRHEAAHYCRGDVWKSTSARLLAMVHWFNPAAWWASSQFDQCAEWSCDEQLAREDPAIAPALARALLRFQSDPRRSPLAAAANGAPLCTRLKRLLQPAPPEDSKMKRAMIMAVIAALAVAGAVRVRLVAQDERAERESLDADFADQLAVLQTRLPDDKLLGKLKLSLSTDEGKLVMKSRASRYSEEAREAAKTQAYDNYLQKRFVKSAGKYELNPEHPELGRELLTRTAEFESDVPKVAAVLEEIAANLRGDDEVTRLVARFMKDEGAMLLYVHEVRKRMRPTLEVVEYRLRQLTVRDSEGNYVLREDHRDEAEQMAEKILPLLNVQPAVSQTLSDWADDLAEVDDLHRQAKRSLKNPSFGFFVAAESVKKGTAIADRPRAFANRIADQLDKSTNETADGMVFRDEARESVAELLAKFQSLDAAATSVRPMLNHIADRITPRDELHRTWAKLLKSEIGALKVGSEIGELADSNDIREVVMGILGNAIVEEDGEFRISDDRREKVAENIQEAIRNHRRIRRYGSGLADFADQVADPKIATALKTDSAPFVAAMAIQDELRQMQVDGLKQWMNEYLQANDDGSLALTEKGTREVESILAEAAQVREELKKDDF